MSARASVCAQADIHVHVCMSVCWGLGWGGVGRGGGAVSRGKERHDINNSRGL